ncbi:MAG: succinate--CoA ligase subunit alpha [Calditrichaceae bacterium]
MSILLTEKSRIAVQGITGSEGSFHAQHMLEYNTKLVAGITPGKGGQVFNDKVPVFNTVAEAVEKEGVNASIIFVPPAFAPDAIMEAAAPGLELVVCITEGIPALDMVKVFEYISKTKARLVGPNCPGVISPGIGKMGIMPAFIHKQGKVGVISRSGTLTYEAVDQLTKRNIGQSTCIGIGGDPVIGTRFIDALELFNEYNGTDAVVMIGEIGGTAEEEAAAWAKENFKKPIVSFIAGQTAPPGRRMGHAGAIISGGQGTAADKMKALSEAGIHVCKSPAEIGSKMEEVLS